RVHAACGAHGRQPALPAVRVRLLPPVRHLEAVPHSRDGASPRGRARGHVRRPHRRDVHVRRAHLHVPLRGSGPAVVVKAWPYPKLFAHRGGGKLAPENTLAAMRLGQSLGYRAVEFDVKLSRDGVAMLLHDATLERTTNGKGDAGSCEWELLAKLDAG